MNTLLKNPDRENETQRRSEGSSLFSTSINCVGCAKANAGFGWAYVVPDNTGTSPPARSRMAVIRSEGVRFASMTEAGASIGQSPTAVSAVCNGNGRTAGGFGWRYG